MQSQLIPRDQWDTFLDEFSRRHVGEPVTIEVMSDEVGDLVEADRLPLVGVTTDNKDSLGDLIEVIAGDAPDANVSRIVHRPTRLQVAVDEDGNEQALQIESVSEPTVLLRIGDSPRAGQYPI